VSNLNRYWKQTEVTQQFTPVRRTSEFGWQHILHASLIFGTLYSDIS